MKRRTFLLSAALAVSGCASFVASQSRQRAGRFSLRLEKDGKSETLNGRWRLKETGETIELTLMTPLYGILARITSSPTGAVFERPNKEGAAAEERAATVEELMQRHLGFSLSTAMLASWLSGHAWPQAPAQPVKNGFAQSGWEVSVRRRKNDGSPALLVLSHPGNASRAAATVNLVIE